MSTLLTIDNLGFAYSDPSLPEDAGAIRELNLQIEAGQRVGLIGPNGAGKTTFFLLTCGLLSPNTGRILFRGQPLPANTFNPKIALVFQKSDDQLFCPSVWEDVAFGPQNLGLDAAAIEQRVQEALRAVGAEALAPRPVHHLSEGEKRLVAVAGAMAMEPELVIYDEPSASLDIRSRRRLINLLRQSRQTFLLASHDLELILEVCDRVLLLDGGRLIADGPPATIMADEELMRNHGQEKPHSLVPHHNQHHR
ncbi:energy-coupling factor ABC transporter ATP-binding protein [Desulfurivibrio alkaliphilus]|uniref:ABC transporter related protein n=1 Tax=Desulfurivibrio alkaliphilus (strain DSM 19089 / UNIQEM U267 / AHT2) TaxID=589865 RepID=D6Z1K0_DESAT|nr:ABC transporter ATP-binding protein [Desulfurivibrio alkaliphilus]ADH87334.1 ABC transporter related protein [Desulfurivibrio alkaliphilus AHT 2]